MKAWKSAWAVGCFALGLGVLAAANAQVRPSPAPGPGPKGGPPPQQQGDMFNFRVCNKSKEDLFVAMLWKVGPDSWKYARWAQFKRGQCGSAGTFPREESYWYAEDGNNPGVVTYPGQDAQGCIGDKNFERTVTGAYSCLEDERIAGFHKITEQTIKEGITLVD